jgi:hypothetical protein
LQTLLTIFIKVISTVADKWMPAQKTKKTPSHLCEFFQLSKFAKGTNGKQQGYTSYTETRQSSYIYVLTGANTMTGHQNRC